MGENPSGFSSFFVYLVLEIGNAGGNMIKLSGRENERVFGISKGAEKVF